MLQNLDYVGKNHWKSCESLFVLILSKDRIEENMFYKFIYFSFLFLIYRMRGCTLHGILAAEYSTDCVWEKCGLTH